MKHPVNFQALKQQHAAIQAKKFKKNKLWWVGERNK